MGTIKQVKLDKIFPYEKNQKKHPAKHIEQVAKSIKEFGFNQPIVVDKQGVIIVGHGRYEAAKALKLDSVPCLEVDLTEEQAKAYRLADNKLNESEWDMNLVIEELKGLSPEMLDLTGFDKDLIIEPDEKDDEVPEIPEEPKSKLGDLYELGQHRVLCGDSTLPEAVFRLMDGKKADMLFTSPPYNAGSNVYATTQKESEGKYEMYQDDKDASDWRELVQKSLDVWREHSVYQFYNIQQLAGNKIAFWEFVNNNVKYLADVAIWNKGKTAPAYPKNVMNSSFEFIFIFATKLNPSRAISISDFRGTVYNVIDLPRDEQNKNAKIHSATFPVSFPTYFIQNFTSSPNAIIADNFLGCGTTLIASEKLGRLCYGMELDPKYIDVIVQRYVDYTGNENIIKNGETIQWPKTKEKTKETQG